ncbi:MAG: hypothetical protein JNM94_10375 [Phycisphaerae bacterium]|nr:hypothetical protein [Phycisphaerae bacterium]
MPRANLSLVSRTTPSLCTLLASLAVNSGPVAIAQESTAPAPATPATAPAQTSTVYWAVVKGDNVMLRSAPTVQGTYPFGRLFTGQPLKVIESDYGWAKVQAIGPTFTNVFGFVKATNATQFNPTTKKLSITGKASLVAPNMDAKFAPDKSWRELITLNAGDSLDVIEEVKAQSDTFYSVRLPEKAFGWVNLQFLAAMPQQEADALEASLKGTPLAAPAPAATATPAATPTSNPAATPTPTFTTDPVAPNATPPATPNANPADNVATGTVTPTTTTPPATTPPPPTITNNPPADDAKPTPESDAEAAARKAAEDAAMEVRVRQTTYADLEAIWNRVKREAAEAAELDALRERYIALAEDGKTPMTTRELAKARAEQLAIRIEAQQALIELANQRASMKDRVQSIADLELASWKRRSFDSVGRLTASTVYNGDRLPLLYKVSDPTTGYTLAYVVPGPGTTPSEALGLVVGVKGRKRFNEALRLTVLEPEVIEVLDNSKTAVVNEP